MVWAGISSTGPLTLQNWLSDWAVLREGVERLCCAGGLDEPCAQVGQCGLWGVEWARDGDVVDRGDGCAEVVDFVRVW